MTEQVEIPFTQVCHSKLKEIRNTFKWVIHNFSAYNDNVKKWHKKTSSMFYALPHESEWFLTLYFFGDCKVLDKDHLSLYLNVQCKEDVYASANVYIIDACGKKCNKAEITHKRFSSIDASSSLSHFISRKALLNPDNRFLSCNTLTILCELTILTDITNIMRTDVPLDKAHVQEQLFESYDSMFHSKSLADVALIIDGKILEAHKAILGAHSPAFTTMFSVKMEEGTKCEVHITDVSYNVFNELLRFIYTGSIKNIDDIVSDLLMAADRYKVEILKIKCEDVLSNALTCDNAIDTLLLGDKYDAGNLIETTLNFIHAHKEILVKDGGFEKIAARPYLLRRLWKIRSKGLEEEEEMDEDEMQA